MPRIQHKRGTSANLASVNPTPLAGELVWDSTENAVKIGDGATAWSSLSYVTATPRTHVHDGGDITTGTVAYARLPVGSTTSTVCAGDDARLTDSRTPTAHASTHATSGSDALTPGDIGAAPAASPTFTGVITVAATSGSAGSYLPSVCISGDPNTGFGQVSGQSDTASVFTAGHERMRVDSSGAIGINATPTTRRLTVRGSSTGDGALLLQSSSTGTGTSSGFIIQCFGAASDAYVWNFENAPIIFGANNAERMRLYADGKLDVTNSVWAVNGSAGSPGFTFRNDTNTGIFQASGSADTLSISTAGVERVRVRSDGGVAIGSAGFANHRFAIIASLTSAGGNIVHYSACTAQTGATSVYGNWTQVSVASGVTLSALHHNYVTQGTFTGAVTTQSGFFVESTLTGATNNYGFRGAIASGTGRWNLYMDGTAQNFLNGNTGIGVAAPSAALDINSDTIRLRTAKTPSSASDTGNTGDICWDANYVYICVSANSWKRATLASW